MELLSSSHFGSRLKAYCQLTKPGIVMGNAITAFGGFALASKMQGVLLGTMLLGLCLIMAAGCVANNWIDRSSDQKMARTQGRVLVTGQISLRAAQVFAGVLTLLG